MRVKWHRSGSMPALIAHRGDSCRAPENTLPALAAALELGVDGIEFDVQLSRDGQLIVFHDADLDRCSTGSGPLAACDLAELRALDAGSWFAPAFAGTQIPTFAEALQLIGTRAIALPELKLSNPDRRAEFAAAVLAELARQPPAATILVHSFDHQLLRELHQAQPELQLAATTDAPPTAAPWHRGVHCRHDLIDAQAVAELRAADQWLCAWTVNDAAAARRLAALGLDGLIGDDVRLLREALR